MKTKTKRQPNKIIYILTEGTQTEPNYFNGIQQAGDVKPGFRLEVKGCGKDPAKMVEDAIKFKKKAQPDDQVWVVFDRDTHKSVLEAFRLAEQSGIGIAFSNICFELWILLHFQYTTRYFSSSNEVIQDIRKYKNEYNKNYELLYKDTADKLPDACTRAQKLRNTLAEQGDSQFGNHSYTNVDELLGIFM